MPTHSSPAGSSEPVTGRVGCLRCQVVAVGYMLELHHALMTDGLRMQLQRAHSWQELLARSSLVHQRSVH